MHYTKYSTNILEIVDSLGTTRVQRVDTGLHPQLLVKMTKHRIIYIYMCVCVCVCMCVCVSISQLHKFYCINFLNTLERLIEISSNL